MERDPRLLTQPLSGPALGLAVARGEAPAHWCPHPPSSASEWLERAQSVQRAFANVRWQDRLASAINASGESARRLERVQAAGGLVVTTGQQPGLFGGPLYTWYKALAALALADSVEASTGIPCAPVFWAATDDSDFAEASWTAVATAGGATTIRLPPLPPDRMGRSMSKTPLADVGPSILALHEASGSVKFPWAMDAVSSAYASAHDTTIGGAYVALLRAILEPLGIAVLDASDASVKRAGEGVLRAALEHAPALGDAIRTRDAEIVAAGYTPQVADVARLCLVFRDSGAGRKRIRLQDAPAASSAPIDELGANVLLRPVLERAILPSVAYVGGAAELAYFAQTGAVADALGAAPPNGVPRWSGVVLESHVAAILERYGLAIDDLRDPHAAEGNFARAAMPGGVRDALAAYRATVSDGAAQLRAASADAHPELVPQTIVDGAERSMLHRLGRAERRLVAAVKRRHSKELEDFATARGSLFPVGKRQERALNGIPFLARYGPAFLDRVISEARVHAATLTHDDSARPIGVAKPASEATAAIARIP